MGWDVIPEGRSRMNGIHGCSSLSCSPRTPPGMIRLLRFLFEGCFPQLQPVKTHEFLMWMNCSMAILRAEAPRDLEGCGALHGWFEISWQVPSSLFSYLGNSFELELKHIIYRMPSSRDVRKVVSCLPVSVEIVADLIFCCTSSAAFSLSH